MKMSKPKAKLALGFGVIGMGAMDQIGLKRDWRRGVRLATALVAVVLAVVPALPAWAGYWTVPVNYYALEDVRYPLNSPQTGLLDSSPIANLAQRGRPDLHDGKASQISYVDDPRRGRVVKFNSVEGRTASFIKGAYPDGLQPHRHGATSLSVWIKPDDIKQDQFVAAGGDAEGGYSLTLQSGRLVYSYWVNQNQQRLLFEFLVSNDLEMAASSASGWLNVIVTQYRQDADDNNPQYAALYVNGLLVDSNDRAPAASGLWFADIPYDLNGYLGSAALSGYVFSFAKQDLKGYSRVDDTSGYELAGLNTYFGGRASEFRLFADTEMVCSDKTRAGYAARNRTLDDGTRCDIGSDVSSISQDRIETDSILARMPFEQDPRDHHFAGLAELPQAETHPPEPTYAPDELRLYAAQFRGGGVRYTSSTGPRTVSGPYSIAFWLRDASQASGTIYRAGNTNAGLNIITQSGQVMLVLWGQEGQNVPARCAVATIDLSKDGWSGDGWHNVVFSVDPMPWAGQGSAVSEAGLTAYVDGKRVAVTKTGKFQTDNDNINVGGVDIGRNAQCGFVPLAAYQGKLSNLQVFKAPITAPQAAQLASRLANAAEAVYDRSEIPFGQGVTSAGNGYNFRHTKSVPRQAGLKDSSAIEFEFTVDFAARTPPARWMNPISHLYDSDCEYVLSGIQARNELKDTPMVPQVMLFCFSPSKISAGLTPFTIAIFYPDRLYSSKINYVPYDVMVWEPLAPAKLLQKLAKFGQAGFTLDAKLKFRISVSAYNIVLQAKTLSDEYPSAPNLVSPVYQGAGALVDAVFGLPPGEVVLISPQNGVADIKYYLIDQRQQLDSFDVVLAKGH